MRGVEFAMSYDTEDLQEISKLVERGVVKPRISRVMSLSEAREAMEINQRGESHGKIVLRLT